MNLLNDDGNNPGSTQDDAAAEPGVTNLDAGAAQAKTRIPVQPGIQVAQANDTRIPVQPGVVANDA